MMEYVPFWFARAIDRGSRQALGSRQRRWSGLPCGFVVACVAIASSVAASAATSNQIATPTHRQVRTIVPRIDGATVQLHTFTTNSKGLIVAGVGGNMPFYAIDSETGEYTATASKQPSAVLVIDHNGETVRQIDVEINPTAVTVAPDDTIYVGGSGKVIQISPQYEIVATIDSPHISDPEAMRKAAREGLIEQKKRMAGMFDDQIEMLNEQIKTIEDLDEDDRSRLQTAQLSAFKQQLKMYEGYSGGGEVTDEEIDQAIENSLSITSIAASNQDVFVCASPPGRGYQVWRVDRDFNEASEPTSVLDGLSGCCGQMDIQCCDDVLVVSENTRFRVGMYDRDGELLQSFGKRDRSSQSGFGSCCNPMNTLPMNDGSILTAESSIGHIKRFNDAGDLVAYIGRAKIGGGCKHCSLGYDAAHDTYFMQSQDENAICVLVSSDSGSVDEAERRIAELNDQWMPKLVGTWRKPSSKPGSEPKTDDDESGILSIIFGGGGGDDGSSAAIEAMKIAANGEVEILSGQYAQMGEDIRIKLEPVDSNSDGDHSVKVSFEFDQVAYLSGTWTAEGDDAAKFDSMMGVTKFQRDADSCEETCGGDDCEAGKCQNGDCANHADRLTANVADDDDAPTRSPLMVVADEPYELNEASELTDTFVQTLTPTWSYKLLPADDLGDEPEAELNRLGDDGWEYVGEMKGRLMFKKMSFGDIDQD